MTALPEIAPEIRGLLEEIVADPRSSIRLVPRRPLREWFDKGERTSATDLARTRAERHLVEEHREELAKLLYDAACIAYCRAPNFAHKPQASDGTFMDLSCPQPRWQAEADRFLASSVKGSEGMVLLKQCLEGLPIATAHELARASLCLVPAESTRYCVAAFIPLEMPRTAAALLYRLSNRHHHATLQRNIFLSLARRLCNLSQLERARSAYRTSCELALRSQVGRCYSFNLSCALGDETGARAEAEELGKVASPQDEDVLRAATIVREWADTLPEGERGTLRRVAKRLSKTIPPAAEVLCEAQGR